MISLKVIPSSLSPHLVGGYRTGMAPLKALIDAHDGIPTTTSSTASARS